MFSIGTRSNCTQFLQLLLLFFCIVWVQKSHAQKDRVDSYQAKINLAETNEARLDSVFIYGYEMYRFGNFNAALETYKEALQLAEKNDLKQYYSRLKIQLARCYVRKNEESEALQLAKEAIQDYDDSKETSEAFLYHMYSRFFATLNQLDSALYYNYIADSLQFKEYPAGLYQITMSRSEIFEKQGLLDLAYKEVIKARDQSKEHGNLTRQLWVLYDLRELCLVMGKIEEYAAYSREYMELSKLKDPEKDFHKGIFDLDDKDLTQNILIMEKVARNYKNSYYQYGYSYALEKLTKLHMQAENWEAAYNTIQAHGEILDQIHLENITYEYHSRKYIVEKELGLVDEALATVDIVMKLRDTIQNMQLAKQNQELQEKFESRAKDQEITILNKENELKDLNIRRSNFTNWVFALGALLLLLFSGFLYSNVQEKKKHNEILEEKTEIIEKNLLEKETLLKEIHHRVKNNLQIISSLLRLQSRTIEDPGTKEALLDGQNRVQSMALIHQNLYKEDNLTGVQVKQYFEKLCRNLLETYNISRDNIQLDLDIEPINLDVTTLIPLGLIVNELFTNSLKYAFENTSKPILGVSLKHQVDHLTLTIYDNGSGLSEGMMTYLNSGEMSRPKNQDWGFGTRLLQTFSKKLEATIQAENRDGAHISMIIRNYKLV